MTRTQVPTDPITSERMRRVRRRHTKPEVKLRKLLWSRGLRYRCNFEGLPGSPDLVNQRAGWAIFINGCFWHGHQGCKRATTPKRNTAFWEEKISANRRRDIAKITALRRLGLEVVTVWECEIEKIDTLGFDQACPQLLAILNRLKVQQPARKE
ncbi:very short patch repair endonuclease [Burkholderia stagnalis]|uniref:very short patch repair endonuclease n=2 Tax=Burkholderia stagnalis TaxID=1503054 RepID=UPI0009BEEDDB